MAEIDLKVRKSPMRVNQLDPTPVPETNFGKQVMGCWDS